MATIENYQTMTFPMQVIGQRYITEIKNFPRSVLSDARNGIVGEINRATTNNMISSDQVMWHKAFSKSCLFEIMTDNSNEVHKACDFSVRQSDISPSYVDLGYGNYVLSNVEKVSIQCNEHDL